MNASTVTIEATRSESVCKGRVVIDDQAVPGSIRRTSLSVDEQPVVALEPKLVQNIKVENAAIVVDDVVITEGVEQAIWRTLSATWCRGECHPVAFRRAEHSLMGIRSG